jgi:hypothetical protein
MVKVPRATFGWFIGPSVENCHCCMRIALAGSYLRSNISVVVVELSFAADTWPLHLTAARFQQTGQVGIDLRPMGFIDDLP